MTQHGCTTVPQHTERCARVTCASSCSPSWRHSALCSAVVSCSTVQAAEHVTSRPAGVRGVRVGLCCNFSSCSVTTHLQGYSICDRLAFRVHRRGCFLAGLQGPLDEGEVQTLRWSMDAGWAPALWLCRRVPHTPTQTLMSAVSCCCSLAVRLSQSSSRCCCPDPSQRPCSCSFVAIRADSVLPKERRKL